MVTSDLADLRRRICETRIALRDTNDQLTKAKAEAEQRAIEAAGGIKGLGSNEAEQKRQLNLAVLKDEGYGSQLSAVRALEATAERLEAELETARDERRAEEWRIRLRLAEALDGRGVNSDDVQPDGDNAFDDSATERATEEVVGEFAERLAGTRSALDEMITEAEADLAEPEEEPIPF